MPVVSTHTHVPTIRDRVSECLCAHSPSAYAEIPTPSVMASKGRALGGC